jgi:predicted outer membrane protein
MWIAPATRALALMILSGAVACAGAVASADRPVRVATVDPDAEALTIALAANAASLHLARLALQRASHPMVRELASARIRDHESAIEWLSVIAYEARIAPAPGADVERLEGELAAALGELRTRWGMSFDRAWLIASEWAGGWLTDRLDSTTLVAVRNGALRAGLAELRDGADAQAEEIGIVREYLVGFHH